MEGCGNYGIITQNGNTKWGHKIVTKFIISIKLHYTKITDS